MMAAGKFLVNQVNRTEFLKEKVFVWCIGGVYSSNWQIWRQPFLKNFLPITQKARQNSAIIAKTRNYGKTTLYNKVWGQRKKGEYL